jgi:prophage antirepressor-like protein
LLGVGLVMMWNAGYKIIFSTNKPIAQKNQEVVCDDILPTLRRKGEYKIQNAILH